MTTRLSCDHSAILHNEMDSVSNEHGTASESDVRPDRQVDAGEAGRGLAHDLVEGVQGLAVDLAAESDINVSHCSSVAVAASTHVVTSREIKLRGGMLTSRSGQVRAGNNLQADHDEEQAVPVEEVEDLGRT